MYGDILSDLAAGLVGGLGVAPGPTSGPTGAVFEATHGSAPKYKGQNKVNPTALILSGMLMLRHLGETDAAARLERAVAAVIAEGKSVTYDLKADRNDPDRRRHPRNGRGDLQVFKQWVCGGAIFHFGFPFRPPGPPGSGASKRSGRQGGKGEGGN